MVAIGLEVKRLPGRMYPIGNMLEEAKDSNGESVKWTAGFMSWWS